MHPSDTGGMERLPLADRLLLWTFRLARTLFLLQGLAIGSATLVLATLAAGPWVGRASLFVGTLSAIFIVAALLITAIRREVRERHSAYSPGSTETVLFAVSLLTVAALTLIVSAGLPPLWRDISVKLSAAGFWAELRRPSQFGGVLMLPLILALAVPAMVTGAAAFSVGFAIVLLARLRSRSAALPSIAAMGAVVQSALVGASWLAVAALGQLSELAVASASSAPDLDVRRLSGELTAAVATLTRIASLLVVPTVLLVAWAGFILWRQRDAGQPGAAADRSFEAPRPDATEPARGPHVVQVATSAAPVGIVLAALGVGMLLFAGADRLRARPEYVASAPEAGTTSSATPRTIAVTFSTPLDPASTLSVVYVPLVPSTTDISKDIPTRSRVRPTDARTMEVTPPPLRRGLYLVRWVAYPQSGGVTRVGSLAFGVGAPVPPDEGGLTYSLTDRDSGSRGRRYTSAGGVLLLVIAALAWSRDFAVAAR